MQCEVLLAWPDSATIESHKGSFTRSLAILFFFTILGFTAIFIILSL
jgi:hypothetical protein